MYSLKATCSGQIFALAKPNDSVGKRTRNRIPKEERKALVESFINKHQNLNNGSFPSLSLTHKEVGGSFYTIREIVREIIQENKVLPGDFEVNGSDHLQDQSPSSSVLMGPVAPLSLSQDGSHFASVQSQHFSSDAQEAKSPQNVENINCSQASPEDRGSDILNFIEVNGNQLFEEDVGLVAHQSMGSTDISSTQFAASYIEENDTKHDAGLQNEVQTVCDSFATKPQDQGIDVDNKGKGFESTPFMESDSTTPVNSDERVKDAGTASPEMANITKNTLGIIDMVAETVVETFPLRSETSTVDSLDAQPGDLVKVCDHGHGKGTETKVETDSSTDNPIDLGEISAAKEFSNRTLTTAENISTSGTESGSCKNGREKEDSMSSHTGNEGASVEKATMEEGKLDASDSSSSQKGNSATLNRIKPASWKERSNMAGHETNPLLAVLKSFLTAFVKFWSE